MRKLCVTLACCCLTGAAFAYYSPQCGRWTTRDPIEENGGVNLYAFCENDPVNKYDPFGKDVYLYQGNNSGDYYNDLLHQSVAVDVWSDDCPPRKVGMQGFSFGYEGEWGWNWPSFSWLGHTGFTLPGYYMVGVVYKTKVIGKQVDRKITTVRQDREWLKYMEKKVGTKDVYSVGRHNCRNFSQSEFDAAPSKDDAR